MSGRAEELVSWQICTSFSRQAQDSAEAFVLWYKCVCGGNGSSTECKAVHEVGTNGCTVYIDTRVSFFCVYGGIRE